MLDGVEKNYNKEPMSQPMRPNGYRPDIDGLRAIAVLSVVAYHAFPSLAPGGFVGVDIFFVISGFLITGIILQAIVAGRFSCREFYMRRIRRIFPALILVLATCLSFGWVALLPDEYEQLGKHVAAGAAFISNVVLWRESGYFDAAAGLKPLLHLWSLGIEEQFYIIWPLALILASRTRRTWFLILAIAGVSFALNVVLIHNHPVATFYSPVTRFWELMIGALLACWSIEASAFNQVSANALAALGATLVVGFTLVLSTSREYPGWWALAPTLGTACLIAAPHSWLNRNLLSFRPVVFVGLISYPLYLWHWPILSYLNILVPEMIGGAEQRAVKCAAITASILLAWLTYEFVERPIRYAPAWAAGSLAISAVALFGLGVAVFMMNGVLFRTEFNTDPFRVSEGMLRSPACASYFGIELAKYDYCVIGPSTGRNRKVDLLVGDSHANGFFPGLELAAANLNRGSAQLGHPGCFPVLRDDAGGACTIAISRAITIAMTDARIERVFIAAQWSHYFSAIGDRAFRQDLDRTLGALRKAGKEVYFVHQIPELDFSARDCLRVRPISFNSPVRTECNVAISQVLDRQRAYRNAMRDILRRHPDVHVVDPVPVMCKDGICEAMMDGKILYRTNDHLSAQGGTPLSVIFQ